MTHEQIYTSQANIKKGNHVLEGLLRDLEYIATVAWLHSPAYRYPKAELDAIWKDLMLNQFHDVLPGTSIAMAIQDALDIYARRVAEAETLIQAALLALNGGERDTLTVFDPYRLPRLEFVTIDQVLTPIVIDSAGLGSVIDVGSLVSPSASDTGASYEISNDRLRLTVKNGRLASLYDLQMERELIRPGPGTDSGGLMVYEDFPLAYDAWDAEVYHQACGREIFFDSVEVISTPLRASLKCTAKFGSSLAVITVSVFRLSTLTQVLPRCRVG
jgi:alpha-mannosidase